MTNTKRIFPTTAATILLTVLFGQIIHNTEAFIPVTRTTAFHQPPQVSSLSLDSSSCTTSVRLQAASLEVDIPNVENATDIEGNDGSAMIPPAMLQLPRHSHEGVNEILIETEKLLKSMHRHSKTVDMNSARQQSKSKQFQSGGAHDAIFSNTYVDLGKVDTVGFDYDYTLVTYTDELLELIYDMALRRLVHDRYYPVEMMDANLKFDPFFSIRGLAVDKETGWICHLSYTHKVAVAWEGRERVSSPRIYKEYRGKRALTPAQRKSRLKPLNDLFSMAECCLIADTIQFFKESDLDYCPNNVVTDILGAIGDTHISGDFHRIVADDPEKYFNPTPHLKSVLTNLKISGKHLILASNSPFWYVDAGMRYVLGENWQDVWDIGKTRSLF